MTLLDAISRLPWDVKRTAIEFAIAYLATALFSYVSVFQWQWLEENNLLLQFMKYPCGGRIVNNENNYHNSSSAPSFSTSIFGEDPFLFNSHPNEQTAISAKQAFYIMPFTFMVYWTSALCFLVADIYYDNFCPKGTWKSKKHPEANMADRPNYKLYRHGIRLATIGCVISIFAVNGIVYYLVRRFRWDSLCAADGAIRDPFYLTAVKFVCVYFATDIYFYWSHRVAHEVGPVYRMIHKEHHIFVDSYAVCAAACHPLEHIFVNIFTVHVPGLIFGVPLLYFQCGWSMLAALNTTFTHSGFRWVPSFAHDQHHHYQLTEYGTDMIMDRIFRTTCRDRIRGPAATMAEEH